MVYEQFFEFVVNKLCIHEKNKVVSFFVKNDLQFVFYNMLSDFMNSDERKEIDKKYSANYIGERIRQITMSKINIILRDEGLNPIFFKGSILAKQLYDDPFVRMVGDIDIFVQPDQIDKAYNLLCTSGYIESYEGGFCNPHHIPLKNGQTYVELHRNFISPFYIKESNFLSQNPLKIYINNHGYETLNVTNTLLHLLLHQYMDILLFFPIIDVNEKHFELPITPRYYYRVFEIALYWEKYCMEVDWSYLMNMLKTIQCSDYLKLLLLNVQSIFPDLYSIEEIIQIMH